MFVGGFIFLSIRALLIKASSANVFPSPCCPGQMEEGHPTGEIINTRAENICNRNIWGLTNSLKEKIKSCVLVCLILIDCLASSVIHHGLVSHPWMTKQQTRVNNQCIKKPYFHFYNATTLLSLTFSFFLIRAHFLSLSLHSLFDLLFCLDSASVKNLSQNRKLLEFGSLRVWDRAWGEGVTNRW